VKAYLIYHLSSLVKDPLFEIFAMVLSKNLRKQDSPSGKVEVEIYGPLWYFLARSFLRKRRYIKALRRLQRTGTEMPARDRQPTGAIRELWTLRRTPPGLLESS
jgi:hypothetical protein